jgi:hypothetical protein
MPSNIVFLQSYNGSWRRLLVVGRIGDPPLQVGLVDFQNAAFSERRWAKL